MGQNDEATISLPRPRISVMQKNETKPTEKSLAQLNGSRKVRSGGIVVFDDVNWRSTAPARALLGSPRDPATTTKDPFSGLDVCAAVRDDAVRSVLTPVGYETIFPPQEQSRRTTLKC